MKSLLTKVGPLCLILLLLLTTPALAAPVEESADPQAVSEPATPTPLPTPDPRPFPQWMQESEDLPLWIYSVDVFPDWFYELEAEPVWFRQIERVPAWFYSLTEIPSWFYPPEPSAETVPESTQSPPEPADNTEYDPIAQPGSDEPVIVFELPEGFEAPDFIENYQPSLPAIAAGSTTLPKLIFKTLLAENAVSEEELIIAEDGSSELYGPILFYAADEGEYDISVWLNSTAIRAYGNRISEAGRYYITITDTMGNSTAYAFRILYTMNISTVWFIVIGAILLIALFVYLLRNRLKVRVR